jgi:pyruvate-formate lyase-activating enzyme
VHESLTDHYLRNSVVTIDFHVTSECSQDCPYCWGPQDFRHPVSSRTSEKIIQKIKTFGIRRVVFTGGDPLQRSDLGKLIRFAKSLGLEVAVSTTGDRLTRSFLKQYGKFIDLISLPLDGSNDSINSKTKKKGHFQSVMKALGFLSRYPNIEVKICTPVTKLNVRDVENIARLVARWAKRTRNRVFYNVFQTFRRSMVPREWNTLLVSDRDFHSLRLSLRGFKGLRINFLSAKTLDRLYVLIFPDGGLYIPSGQRFDFLGNFLDVNDLETVLAGSDFSSRKHRMHSRMWEKTPAL